MQICQFRNRQVRPGEMFLQFRKTFLFAGGKDNRAHSYLRLLAEPLKRLLSQFQDIPSSFLTGFERILFLLQFAVFLPERSKVLGLFGEGIRETPDLQYSHLR